MKRIARIASRYPRVSAALCFGVAATLTAHFAWMPDARLSGRAPLVTLGAGLAHGASGAFIGRRLMDRARTRAASQAFALGAATSLCALVIFAVAFALWIQSSNAAAHRSLSFLAYVPFVAFFAFLAAGWALMLVSVGVGWVLFRLVSPTG